MGPRAVLADGYGNKKISRINGDYKHGVMYFVASYFRHQHLALQKWWGCYTTPVVSLRFSSVVRRFQTEVVFDQRAVSDRSP